MGSNPRFSVIMLGSVNLKLSSKGYLYLEECYNVHNIVNTISISFLDMMGYVLNFKNKYCSIYFRSKFIAIKPLIKGLYLADISFYSLQLYVALMKSKQSVNEAYSSITNLAY